MIFRGVRKSLTELAELFHRQDRIIVMGVVNATPDSFSDGGQYFDSERAVAHALKLVGDGADIIDIGGESTRPGAVAVTAAEELRRVIPIVTRLATQSDIAISIDTSKAEVARAALAAGAAIVNDITALSGDSQMAGVIAAAGAGVILMHKRGTPVDMQANTEYNNLVGEIRDYLGAAVARAEQAGIDPQLIMVDPGIGFGKDLAGNLAIIRSVKELAKLGKPVLIGASRKSFIGRLSDAPAPERLGGSLAAATAAVLNGAAAVRVHDVKETRQAVDVAIRLRGEA